jgi:hypothetical protein
MKRRTLIQAMAAALVLSPVAGLAAGPGGGQGGSGNAGARGSRGTIDRDRIGTRDYDRDRIRDRDRIHTPEKARIADKEIYGHEMMTRKERNEYREQLRLIGNDEAKRTQFMAEHREKMQARARAQTSKP